MSNESTFLNVKTTKIKENTKSGGQIITFKVDQEFFDKLIELSNSVKADQKGLKELTFFVKEKEGKFGPFTSASATVKTPYQPKPPTSQFKSTTSNLRNKVLGK